MTATRKHAFDETHDALRTILERYQGRGLTAHPDKPGHYVLKGPQTCHST